MADFYWQILSHIFGLEDNNILLGSSLLKPDLRRPSAPDGNIRDSVSRLSMSSTPAAKAEHRRLQEERRLLVLLIGIVVMFFICVTPAAILLILPVADEDFGLGLKLFRAVANLLELTNYALNFYVYVGCSSDFRTTFVSVFCNKWVKRQENGDYERSLTAIKATGSRKGTIEITAPGSGSSTPLMRPRNGVDGQNNVNVVRTMDKQDVLKVWDPIDCVDSFTDFYVLHRKFTWAAVPKSLYNILPMVFLLTRLHQENVNNGRLSKKTLVDKRRI